MDFDIPAELASYLRQLDEFIEREIKPLEQADDNIRFFDHRRENARTDWDRGGLPSQEWEALLEDSRLFPVEAFATAIESFQKAEGATANLSAVSSGAELVRNAG